MKRVACVLKRLFYLLALISLLTACGLRNAEYNLIDRRANLAGASQLFSNDEVEKIDLKTLLDPSGKRFKDERCRTDAAESNDLDASLNAFNLCYTAEHQAQAMAAGVSLDSWRKQRRNQIQERVLFTSNQYCNVVKIYLQRAQSSTNFSLGSLATVAGIAGGVVTGLDGSRILSGISGALSGVNAEFNQAFFLGRVVPVITKGMDLRRKQIYDDVVRHGQQLPYSEYDLESALKDAVIYHGACSVSAALEAAADSIDSIEHPGLDQAFRTIVQVNAISREMNSHSLNLQSFRQVRRAGYLEGGKVSSEDSRAREAELPFPALIAAITQVKGKAALAKTATADVVSEDGFDGAATITAELGKHETAVLEQLRKCQAPSELATSALFDKQRIVAEAVDSDDKKRAETELVIAHEAASRIRERIQTASLEFGAAVDTLMLQATAKTQTSESLKDAIGGFVGAITKSMNELATVCR